MLLQTPLTPGGELLLQIAVEPTDGTGTRGDSHQGSGDFSYFVRTGTRDEHLGQTLGHLRFIAAIALEDLGVELALAISRHLQILNSTCGRDQVTSVIPIAIALAGRATLSPADPDERV
jgi:hypothetical protein